MLKEKLRDKVVTIGSWITLRDPAVAEIMAKAGYDWLVVDCEHSILSIEAVGEIIRTIDLCQVTPLVRLTSNDANQIKRVMDAGAHGIIVPMVNSVEEAQKAVAAVHYAPLGHRGVGLARAQGYGASFQEYLSWQQKNPVVIVQIEHIDALKNCEAILTVPGIDGFIIGPYDLSCSMGIPGEFERPEFKKVMSQILDAGRKAGCPAGLHIVEPDLKRLAESVRDGFVFIAYSVDIRFLDVALREGVQALKERW